MVEQRNWELINRPGTGVEVVGPHIKSNVTVVPLGAVGSVRKEVLAEVGEALASDEALIEDLFCAHQRSDILPRLQAALATLNQQPADAIETDLKCYRTGDGSEHDEAFRCAACERPVCGYCGEPVGNEWLCPDCPADPENPAQPATETEEPVGEEPDHFTRCGGEPTNPTFYGVDSEAELAAEDGYCRGCPDCQPESPSSSHAELVIDAAEFAEARRDPRTKELLRRADEYGERLKSRSSSTEGHRVEIDFDHGSPSVKLIHPEQGCPEEEEGEACFLVGWLENEGAELLRGKLTLPVRWSTDTDGDYPLFHVEPPATTPPDGGLEEWAEEVADRATALEDLAALITPGGPQPDYEAVASSLNQIASELAGLRSKNFSGGNSIGRGPTVPSGAAGRSGFDTRSPLKFSSRDAATDQSPETDPSPSQGEGGGQ